MRGKLVHRVLRLQSPQKRSWVIVLKVLGAPNPTPEQLKIIGDTRTGTEVIRGAAGSGKTTTALLRLRNLSDMFRARHTRLSIAKPVRALVLTYNRTLCGYVAALAEEQATKAGGVQIEVSTYAKWAVELLGAPKICGNRTSDVQDLGRQVLSHRPVYARAETTSRTFGIKVLCVVRGKALGAALGGEPKWTVQDRDYIVSEAARLADIAAGKTARSFHYPDLMKWSPPTTQGDAVGTRENSYFIAGLGRAEPIGEVWANSEAEWQWLKLEFGQTVLAKRRPRPRELRGADLPVQQPPENQLSRDEPYLFSVPHHSKEKGKAMGRRESFQSGEHRSRSSDAPIKSLDELSDWVIRENFAPEIIGRALLNAAQGSNPVDRAAALAAIIAKAVDARRRRSAR
jgi:hypothetical protein